MKKKLFLFLLFIILCFPLVVDAVTIAYTETPRGGNCDSNGENCAEWYDPIYSDNSYKYRMYCLDEVMKGPGKSGVSYTYIAKYDIKGKGPACAFIAKNVPTDYWNYNKFSTSGNTSSMIKYDYIIKRYIQDNYNNTTQCSKYYYVSGNCDSKNKAAVDDGSTIDVSIGAFSVYNDTYSIATVTVKPTKSISKWTVKVSGVSGVIITDSKASTTNLNNKSVSNKTMYVKVPRNNVSETETVKVSVTSTYTTSCTYKMPVLKMFYRTSYVTNGALNATGKKYFNTTTGRRLASVPASAYQSVGFFGFENNTVTKSNNKFDSASRSLNPSLGDIKIIKKDSITKDNLVGVKFNLYSGLGCKTLYKENLTTDANGIIEISGLPVGTYSLKEVNTVAGYKLNDVCIDNKIVKAAETTSVEVLNDPSGAIEIYKSSFGFNSAIAGVTFELYKDSSCNTKINSVSTGSDGKAKFVNLEAGTYYLKEVTPDGYAENKEYSCKLITVEKGITEEIKITNVKNLSLTINKTDGITGEAIKGVKFKLCTDSNCNVLAKDTSGNVINNLVTDDNGKIIVNNLKYGVYYYKEIEVPNGYLLDNSVSKIVIDGNEVLNIKNSAIQLEIEKVSLINKKMSLPGSQIRLAYLSDVTDGNLDQIIYNTVVSEDKNIFISVVPGVYAIYEDYAPTGFINLEEAFLIEVKDNGTITEYTGDEYNDILEYPVAQDSEFFELKDNKLTIVNEPTYIKISKQDITSYEEVEGATIIIYDENGNEKDKYISDGKVSNKFYLEPGEYTLVEQVPPKGYKKIETKINFTLGNYGFISLEDEENAMYTTDGMGTIILYNEAEWYEVPITGISKNIILIILGISLVVGGIYIIQRRKKAY